MQNNQSQLNGWFGRMLHNVSNFIENNLSFLPYAGSVSSVLTAGAGAFGTGCKPGILNVFNFTSENGYLSCRPTMTVDGILPDKDEHTIESFFSLQFFPYLKKLMTKVNAIITNTVVDRTAAINEVLTEMALLKHFAENNTLDIEDETFFELKDTILATLKANEDQIKSFFPVESSMVNVSLVNTDISPIAYSKPNNLSVKLYGKGSVATTQVTENSTAVTQVATATVNQATNTVTQVANTTSTADTATSKSGGTLVKIGVGVLVFWGLSKLLKSNKKESSKN
jgi:hypothetical protein